VAIVEIHMLFEFVLAANLFHQLTTKPWIVIFVVVLTTRCHAFEIKLLKWLGRRHNKSEMIGTMEALD
jgi:hypothetical protein